MGRFRLLVTALILGPCSWMGTSPRSPAAECDPGPCFRRGDSNADGYVDVSDALYLLNFLFRGGDALSCPAAGDFDASQELNLTDAVYLLNYLYLGRAAPPAPFPGCGPAPPDCLYPASLCAGGPVRAEDPTLHLAFDGPLVLEGAPGEKVAARAVVTLDNSFVGAPPVDGWNLSLRTVPVETLSIKDLSIEDTVSTTFVREVLTDPGNEGAITVSIIQFGLPLPLSVDQPPHRLINLHLEATIPASGCVRCQLLFHDGLLLHGVPHENFVTSRGRRFHPFSRPLEVQVCAAIPELTLDATREFTLTPASPEALFKVLPPAGAPLLIELADDDPEDANTLYLGWARLPSPVSFDEAAARSAQAGQRLIVPFSRGGSLYLLAQGLTFHQGESRLRLLARLQGLALDSISTDCAARGCSGEIHAVVRGGGFDDRTAFSLERPEGGTIAARESSILGDDRAEVLFDLAGAAEGEYDLVARKPGQGGGEGRLPRAVLVVPPRIGPRLELKLEAPAYYRPGRSRELKVIYRNSGDEEMPAPYLRLSGPPETTFCLEGDEWAEEGGLDFLAIHRAGIAGRLPPGAEGEIIVLFRNQAAGESMVFRVHRLEAAPNDHLDWETVSAPAGVLPEEWELVRPRLAESMGANWPECHRALADHATRSARLEMPAAGVLALWRFAYREALRGPSAAVLGKVRDAAGLPFSSRQIAALDPAGIARACDVTGAEGEFVLSLLAPGAYTLFIETFQDPGPQVTVAAGEDLAGIVFTPQDPGQVNFDCPIGDSTGLPRTAPAPPAVLFREAAAAAITPVGSEDPNEKEGPGEGLPVPRGQAIRYTIYFENRSTATAAVQTIEITDVLDPRLDPLSVVLDPVQIGNDPQHLLSFPVPEAPGSSYRFEGAVSEVLRIPYPEVEPTRVLVDVVAELDREASAMKWTIRALDPNSQGELFEDRAGILPPNDESHRGEGHLSFTVRVLPDAKLGDSIENQATIRFDDNEIIATGVVRNPVGPSSSVPFRRGDVNQDGEVDLSDAVYLFDYLFREGEEIRCLDAADVNDDGGIRPDISDPIYLLNWKFLGDAEPPQPGPFECGLEPADAADLMDCPEFAKC